MKIPPEAIEAACVARYGEKWDDPIDVDALRARVSDLEDDVAHLRSAEQEAHADLVRARGTIEELRAERDRLREELVRVERVADANECECDGDGPVGARCVTCQLQHALDAKEGT